MTFEKNAICSTDNDRYLFDLDQGIEFKYCFNFLFFPYLLPQVHIHATFSLSQYDTIILVFF